MVCALLTLLMGLILQPLMAHADAAAEMNTLIKNYGRTCAVQVYSMDDRTTLYAYQKDKLITGASTIKLPYCVYVCTQLEKGVRSLDETIKYTSSWYHGGSGIIRKNGYGKTYTIRQLIDYAMRYSDNVAYDMLVYLFGVGGFNSMVDEWGYSIHIGESSPRFPSVTADFMRTAMERMADRRNDGEAWQTAWTALCESTNTYVRGAVGSDTVPVAVKYGNVSSVWHEVCYVGSETPYVVVILSSATNMSPNTTFLKNVAKCADRIVQEYEAQKPDEPETTEPTDSVTDPPKPDPIDPDQFLPVDADKISTGDLNGDSLYTTDDAAWILQAIAMLGVQQEVPMTETQLTAADVNGNAFIDTADAAVLLSYIAYMGAGGEEELTAYLRTETDAAQPETMETLPTESPTDPTENQSASE